MKANESEFDLNLRNLEELVDKIKKGDVKISELKDTIATALEYVNKCKAELLEIKNDIERETGEQV